jgi:hypothetical protein
LRIRGIIELDFPRDVDQLQKCFIPSLFESLPEALVTENQPKITATNHGLNNGSHPQVLVGPATSRYNRVIRRNALSQRPIFATLPVARLTV